MENEETQKIIAERKQKIFSFFKNSKEWVYYVTLTAIVFLGVWIRTLNIPKLKDITTGGWALAPDLDPYLFLRWAQDIVANGKLMMIDPMRYAPIGFNTAKEMKLLSYMIAWFHQILASIGLSTDVTYSAILFPAIMFGFTTIAFFLFARKVFYKEEVHVRNLIALASTLLFVLVPSLLPRTIAGIPEKESVAFGFMFLALYFVLEAFAREKTRTRIIFGILGGIATALMALTWGGVIFVFFTIPFAIIISFFLGKIEKNETIIYSVWMITSFVIMMSFSLKYTPTAILTSLSTMLALGVWLILILHLALKNNSIIEKIKKRTKIPETVIILIAAIIFLAIFVTIIFGLNFLPEQIKHTIQSLISPKSNRHALTVAENKQPYFVDWKGSFGPNIKNIPLFFWLFFVGAVFLFYKLIEKLSKKEKIYLTAAYFIFLVGLIFSRHSPNSTLNGENFLSVSLYFLSVAIFLLAMFFFYHKISKENKFDVLKELNFGYILYFVLLTLGIIAARSGVRLIMALGAIAPLAIGFLLIKIIQITLKEKSETKKIFLGLATLIIILSFIFTIWAYYEEVKVSAENFAPSAYNWQWQNAMQWVRENTPENAIFAHWWDYGYWLQSIGQRATVLDGGNAINYWNYLMGRYVLTEPSLENSLSFLYSHNTTHLLIDSTDIGKYPAFSSIGSDENYDRFSWISTFVMDDSLTQEMQFENTYVYGGSVSTVDQDIVWTENGSEIFIPSRSSGMIGIVLKRNNSNGEFQQPLAAFYNNGKQTVIPLRYLYENKKLKNFNSGLEAGIFVFPSVSVDSQNQVRVNKDGALFYLSPKTINSNLVRLYLFDEKSKNFKLVNNQDNLIVANLKQQMPEIGDFIYYREFHGPIKIWEINYPKNIEINQSYLQTKFPNPLWDLPQEGTYH